MNLETPLELFSDHFSTINQRWNLALDQCGFDSAVIYAGEQAMYFTMTTVRHLKPIPICSSGYRKIRYPNILA
jgi:hypothetical protein